MKRLAVAILIPFDLLTTPLSAEGQAPGGVYRVGHLDGTSPSARTTLLADLKGRDS